MADVKKQKRFTKFCRLADRWAVSVYPQERVQPTSLRFIAAQWLLAEDEVVEGALSDAKKINYQIISQHRASFSLLQLETLDELEWKLDKKREEYEISISELDDLMPRRISSFFPLTKILAQELNIVTGDEAYRRSRDADPDYYDMVFAHSLWEQARARDTGIALINKGIIYAQEISPRCVADTVDDRTVMWGRKTLKSLKRPAFLNRVMKFSHPPANLRFL